MPSPQTTHVLAYPIDADGNRITEITLRRPKGADLREFEGLTASGSQYASTTRMIAILSDLPAEMVDELDIADISAISTIVEGFFPKPRPAAGGA